MVLLRHKGCTTPIVGYIGKTPLTECPAIREAEWVFRKEIVFDRPLIGRRPFFCPDCGERIGLHPDLLESCDGTQ